MVSRSVVIHRVEHGGPVVACADVGVAWELVGLVRQ